MSRYHVAPVFVIRAAGVPFDHLEKLATPRTAAAGRAVLRTREEFQKTKSLVEDALGDRTLDFSAEFSSAWRKALRAKSCPPRVETCSVVFNNYVQACENYRSAEAELKQAVDAELEQTRRALLESSRAVLPAYLVFGAGEFRERLSDICASGDSLPPRNARTRERERHLLLYLQRVAGKNDTFSQFGPSAWGRIVSDEKGLRFGTWSKSSQRDNFLERWTAHLAAAAINRDPETRMEIPPRVNPNGRLEENAFVLADTNETIQLSAEDRAALLQCDGDTPAYALGFAQDQLAKWAEQKLLRWQIEPPAMEPYAFDTLLADVRSWRESEVRTRWLSRLEPIAALPRAVGETDDLSQRIQIMDDARQHLRALGVEQQSSQRHLYAAANPIAEECYRGGDTTLGQDIAEQFVHDAEPWIDLWRDTYAFVASRVAEGLRKLFDSTPRTGGFVSLSAFLRHCATEQMPLTGHGCVVLAHAAFQEVKCAFRKQIEDRAQQPEIQLTRDDCHLVRRSFEYPKFDEYTFPSADLQISARSLGAIAEGDFDWILGELHPPPALLHHCFYWGCPDKAELSRSLAATTNGRPNFHFGFAAADFTAHTTVRLFDALPDLSWFVAAQRGKPSFRTVPPAEVEVCVDETGDVCLCHHPSGERVGSFARAWLIPLGFHPFHFGRAPHMPRLRLGGVIVQRRSWTVSLAELPKGDFSGVSTDLVLAVEHLRAEKGWPRYIYARPTEQALRRSGAEGRDKDTKPVFIDLESYLSLEIFHRWLNKSGELEVTEMLPDPEHLCWQENDGRRTFELRTLIVPRA